MARSLEEAIQAATTDYGAKSIEDATNDGHIDDARPLTDEEMDRLKFRDSDDVGAPKGRSRSFRREMWRRVAAGVCAPEMFATTEI